MQSQKHTHTYTHTYTYIHTQRHRVTHIDTQARVSALTHTRTHTRTHCWRAFFSWRFDMADYALFCLHARWLGIVGDTDVRQYFYLSNFICVWLITITPRSVRVPLIVAVSFEGVISKRFKLAHEFQLMQHNWFTVVQALQTLTSISMRRRQTRRCASSCDRRVIRYSPPDRDGSIGVDL